MITITGVGILALAPNLRTRQIPAKARPNSDCLKYNAGSGGYWQWPTQSTTQTRTFSLSQIVRNYLLASAQRK